MATPASLAALDCLAQAELVRRGELSPRELVDAAIERIERLDGALNALVSRDFERARERAADPALAGPLRGVPFLMKDIGGPQSGRPSYMGMRALRDADYREPADGYLTRKLEAAGLVLLGRTTTPELALLPVTEPESTGPTRNPWSLDHSPGGSSGGAGAAVASGMVAAAHASDGGGSIRGPASMSGLVGLKPSRGRCSFGPGAGERWGGLSCEFALTRSVRDTAALLDVASGPMPGDPYSAAPPAEPFARTAAEAPPALRVGVLRRAPRGDALAPECLAAVERTARALEALGHRVEESHPGALDDPEVVAAYVTLVCVHTAFALEGHGRKVGRVLEQKDVEPLTWALAERGRAVAGPDYLAALDFAHRLGRRFAAWWGEGFDLLLTATQAAPPPEIGYVSSTAEEPLRAFLRAAPYGICTLPFNLSGQPAISLPVHWSDAGLPVGAQLVGATGAEGLLLQLAGQLEQALPWAERRPPLFG